MVPPLGAHVVPAQSTNARWHCLVIARRLIIPSIPGLERGMMSRERNIRSQSRRIGWSMLVWMYRDLALPALAPGFFNTLIPPLAPERRRSILVIDPETDR
jgi:hypothetical protein